MKALLVLAVLAVLSTLGSLAHATGLATCDSGPQAGWQPQETLQKRLADNGDIDGAIRMWLRILDRDPFDEGAHLELVRVLIRAGRHGEARRRYGVYSDRMAEIGVEASRFPDPVRAG